MRINVPSIAYCDVFNFYRQRTTLSKSTVTLNKFSGDTYLREYLPQKILTKPPGREGGEGARIRNDSQVGKN